VNGSGHHGSMAHRWTAAAAGKISMSHKLTELNSLV
jgi:hypothetical protein